MAIPDISLCDLVSLPGEINSAKPVLPSNNRKAVQIKSNIDHEKQETLNNLKVLREDRELSMKQANEAIIRLLDTKNEFT